MPKTVPYLREEQIERDTAALLAEYEQARGVKIVRAVPIEDIVEKHLRLGIEFDDMHQLLGIPRSGLGPDILGAMYGSSSTKASIPRRSRSEKAATASRWRTRAGIGDCTATCSPRTLGRLSCSTSRPRRRSSVVRTRRKNPSSDRRTSTRRAY
jgi:hypothetical protein